MSLNAIYRPIVNNAKSIFDIDSEEVLQIVKPWNNWDARIKFITEFGFSLITPKVVAMMKILNVSFVSIGCGSGWAEKILQNEGIDIIPTDFKLIGNGNIYPFKHTHLEIENISAFEALKKYKGYSIYLSWPCYDEPWAYNVLRQMAHGSYIVYHGELWGCTADDKFHELLLDEKKFKMICNEYNEFNWNGIHDKYIIAKKL